MFGFPFFTSLIVVLAGVIGLSLIINKGLTKRKQLQLEANSTQTSH